jgi:hypothetical protein
MYHFRNVRKEEKKKKESHAATRSSAIIIYFYHYGTGLCLLEWCGGAVRDFQAEEIGRRPWTHI